MNPSKWPRDFQLVLLGVLCIILVALICALAVGR